MDSFAHVRITLSPKELTLEQLHKTLFKFTLYAERVGEVIELARHVFSNKDLPRHDNLDTMDELKKLVVEYMICEIDIIGLHDKFVSFMEEDGEFVGMFWGSARRYVA